MQENEVIFSHCERTGYLNLEYIWNLEYILLKYSFLNE